MRRQVITWTIIGTLMGLVCAFFTVYAAHINELLFATLFLILTIAEISLAIIGTIATKMMGGDDLSE
jgi:hypothetical protein